MKKAFGEYRHIAGSARARGSVWEGPDHLLCIEIKGYPAACLESYRRIDYARIQAITYGRTSTWAWNITWQVLIILGGGFLVAQRLMKNTALLSSITPELLGSILILLAIVLPALIINLFKGPTCVCNVQTAVQSLRLKPVSRVRDARKLASRIATACQLLQGGRSTVTQEELAALPALDPGPFVLQMKRPFVPSPLLTWGFGLLLAGGCLAIAEPFVDNLAFFIADVVLNLAGGTMLVVARMRSVRIMMPGFLSGLLKAVARTFVFSLVLSFGLYIYASFVITQERALRGRPVQIDDDVTVSLLRWLSHASFEEVNIWAGVVMAVGGINVFLALLGLPSVLRSRPLAVPPPLPPVSPQATATPSPAIEFQPPLEP